MTLELRATADITGAVTNHVKVRKRADESSIERLHRARERANLKTICISIPRPTLERLDEVRRKLGLSRSKLLQLGALELATRWGL